MKKNKNLFVKNLNLLPATANGAGAGSIPT
jgi:hypothetical protein